MFKSDYIVGLVDGEGSFTANIRDPNSTKQPKRRARAEPRFYVKLQEGDKVILDELKRFFRCGNVYFQKDSRENHKDCYRYEVANRKDLSSVVIPFFKKHQLKMPSKKKDFEIFVEIMEKINNGDHLTEQGLKKLFILKQKMH